MKKQKNLKKSTAWLLTLAIILILTPTFGSITASAGNAELNNGTVGVSYNEFVDWSKSVQVVSKVTACSIIGGELPPGLSVVPYENGFYVRGTPTRAGAYVFEISGDITTVSNHQMKGAFTCSIIIEQEMSFAYRIYFDFEYTIDEYHNATIIKYHGSESNVTIPDEIIYINEYSNQTYKYPVIAIKYGAFNNISNLTEVTIPQSIAYMGESSFIDCYNLSIAYLKHSSADQITQFAEKNSSYATFTGTASDFKIIYPTGSSGFTTPLWKEYTAYPDNFNADWDYTFLNGEATITKYKGSLDSIEIPSKLGEQLVTNIGSNVFGANIKSVTIPNTVKVIAKDAFTECKDLTEINVISSNNNFSSENGVLFNKDKTQLIIYPVGKPGEYIIPNSVKTIAESAFDSSVLTSVTIPNNVISIGNNAFVNCSTLSVAYFKHLNANTISLGNNVFSKVASDFKILYPVSSTGFTTPTWKNYPASPDIPLAQEASDNVKKYIDEMISEEKTSPDDIDKAILFAENEVLKAASKDMTGNEIIVNKNNLQELQTQASNAKTLIEQTFEDKNTEIMRDIRTSVSFNMTDAKKVTIKVEPSAADMTADNVEIHTLNYTVSIPKQTIIEDVKSSNLIITIEEVTGTAAVNLFAGTNPNVYAAATKKEVKYKVTLSRELKENIKYSFEPASGDVNYQAVFRSDETPVGGKYNPVTEKVDVRIRYSDTYTVKENKKDFGDISTKSKEMQEAIRILASKGIINGTSAKTFNPDGTITRAEIAALIVRTLSKLNENADGKFKDVKKTDWYFGAVGSAKSYGIINGMTETTFEPVTQIKKEQIIAIAARTLRSEMKWKTPGDKERYLKKFSDRNTLSSWGIDDFALASMADLILLRTDGKFNPTDTMTRGDAAIILYRLFMKIW